MHVNCLPCNYSLLVVCFKTPTKGPAVACSHFKMHYMLWKSLDYSLLSHLTINCLGILPLIDSSVSEPYFQDQD